jgi:DnaJ-class molecular chaperone
MSVDLYASLGVQRDADRDEISKAYKKLAMVHHPDRGGNAEEFKKIQMAHEILTDDDRRRQYDMSGSVEGDGQQGHPGGFPFDMGGMGGLGGIFGSMFGGMGGMGGMPQQRQRRPKGPAKVIEIALSLADFYKGKHLRVNFDRQKFCGGCAGEGATSFRQCDTCQGRGVTTQMAMIGPGMAVQMNGPCRDCQGRCKKPADSCKTCQGRKFQNQEKTLDVTIEQGMPAGEVLVFPNECSDNHEYDTPGDVHFVLQAADETLPWKRQGDDLCATVTVSLKESLLGVSKTLEGHPGFPGGYTIGVPVGTIHTEVIRKQGDGMPRKGRSGPKGDVLITVKIDASAKDKEVLERNKVLLQSMFS